MMYFAGGTHEEVVKRAEQQHTRLVARKDARIRQLEGVIVELANEVLALKNGDRAS